MLKWMGPSLGQVLHYEREHPLPCAGVQYIFAVLRQITRGAANHYCWFFLRHVLILILNFILMCVEGGDGLVGGLDGTQVDRFARMFL